MKKRDVIQKVLLSRVDGRRDEKWNQKPPKKNRVQKRARKDTRTKSSTKEEEEDDTLFERERERERKKKAKQQKP